ncbi:unnamed protein product [Dimorphilus gyrociliatus]|uniref:Protein-serine/threonine kinase n=1 Tax=Dimorphilus gyrociliatus TaxID=2664684 RepID=A0A7I8V8W2_9ANNE|nr:unnamed protein product [Dimorphilus gyrociliatus]
MAQGVIEMKEDENYATGLLEKQVQYFLDRFYMSRISIRMLINQHTLLFDPERHQSSKHIGAIDPACRVQDVAQDAYENAKFLCEQYYLNSPDCVFESVDPSGNKEGSLTVTYVPSHLYHILFELFKNALRAVVETHGQKDSLPDIKVMICKGNEDLTIKIHDEGGGISRSQLPLLFNYMYSTAPRPPSPAAASSTPLAGYGYGLPLSRLYAKYFLGDLHLSSVEGYGTDAYVNIKVFPDDASELLPVYNKTSSAKYHTSQSVSDWSDPIHSSGLHSRNFSTLSNSRKRTLRRKS